MNRPPKDITEAAERVYSKLGRGATQDVEAIEAALAAERQRWKPAVTYFEKYCQDEAEDEDNCVCGQEQHEDAKAFELVVRGASK